MTTTAHHGNQSFGDESWIVGPLTAERHVIISMVLAWRSRLEPLGIFSVFANFETMAVTIEQTNVPMNDPARVLHTADLANPDSLSSIETAVTGVLEDYR